MDDAERIAELEAWRATVTAGLRTITESHQAQITALTAALGFTLQSIIQRGGLSDDDARQIITAASAHCPPGPLSGDTVLDLLERMAIDRGEGNPP
ncbi:MAG: hypothetical protein ACRC67_33380 [Inquilinus sp.]|uniref:hypothetical protein n=1 Tax=Inquilinus sp. TaxID=1932117 RepID=UPI003F2E9291